MGARFSPPRQPARLPTTMKVEFCNFSGYKIYPGKGKLYIRSDSKIFRFVTSKEESLFLQRKNPRKIAWTTVFRRVNKKGVSEEVAKKSSRKTVRAAQRAAAVTEAKDKKKEREAQRKSQRASNKPVANAVPKGGKVGRGAR